MAEPDEPTRPQDDAARVEDTRRALELGLPPARGTTAPGHGRAEDGQIADGAVDGIRSLDEHRNLRGEQTPERPADGGRAGGAEAGGATAAGGGAAAGGAASGASAAAAAGPAGVAAEKAKEIVEKAQAVVDAHTVEEIWKSSEPQPSQGSVPDHRRSSGPGRPPGQSGRSGPGNRGPNR